MSAPSQPTQRPSTSPVAFQTIDDTRLPAPLAALDPRTGRLLPWRPPAYTLSPHTGTVATFDGLVLLGQTLYVSSVMPMVLDGQTRNALAAINASTGQLLPWHLLPFPSGAAFWETTGLFYADGTLFGPGSGQNTAGGAANPTTGHLVPGPWGNVTAFTAKGPIIYIGGGSPDGFSEIDNQPRNNLAAINLATGQLTPWAPNVNTYSYITSMAASGDQILASGDFASTLG